MTRLGRPLVCKIHGSSACYNPEKDLSLGLAISAWTTNWSFTKIVKDGGLDIDSEVCRFLCGEEILTSHCGYNLCVSEDFLAARNINLYGESDYSELCDFFQSRLAGGVECPVDQDVGLAKLFIVPGSLTVEEHVQQRKETERGMVYFLKLKFSAKIQMVQPLKPSPLEFFRTGVYCDSTIAQEKNLRNTYELALGVLFHRDQLYISRDVSFIMVKPDDSADFKDVLIQEMASHTYNVYGFANYAAFVTDDEKLKARLLRFKSDRDY